MNRVCVILVAFLLLSSSAAFCETIAEVKSSTDWMQVTVEGILTYAEPNECYIEATDRSGGIWVQAPTTGFSVGDPVVAIGTFTVLLGEPIVLDASIYPQGQPVAIGPFGMKNAAVGGASKWSPMWIWDYSGHWVPGGCGSTWQYDWAPASGASNTGLLVKTWGTVKSLYHSPVNGASWLYVDDGSGVVSDLGDVGVLVYSDAEVNRGDFVSVQGISSTELSRDQPDKLIRVIRTRDAADVVLLRDSEPERPFSDEFDKPALDQRWGVVAGSGSVSTSAEPGWLAVTAQPSHTSWPMAYSPQVVQYVPGDWDLEIKVRDQLGQTPDMISRLGVAFRSTALPPPPSQIFPGPPRFSDYRWSAYTYHGSTTQGGPIVNQVYLGSWAPYAMPSDTCYLRFRKRGRLLYSNVSFDGSSYLPKDVPPFWGDQQCDWLVLCASTQCVSSGIPFTSFIDYVRFTPVGQGGSQ